MADVERGAVRNGMYPSYVQPVRKPPRRWFPIFTLLAFVANIVVFVIVMYKNNCPAHVTAGQRCLLQSSFKRMSFQPWKENPLLGPSSATLQDMGGLVRSLVVQHKQGWRLMSAVWLHAGVFHLVVNMIALLIFGIQLEKEFGFIRIALLYLISGLGGTLLSALFINTSSVSVGASGALFGLLGGCLSELITNWSHYSSRCSQLFQILIVAGVSLAVGLLPYVDNWAHIGGFITGFLLGFVILMKHQYAWVSRRDLLDPSIERPVSSRHNCCQYVLLIVSVVLLLAGFAAGFGALYKNINVNKHCSWCHYLDCIPTSAWTCNSASQ